MARVMRDVRPLAFVSSRTGLQSVDDRLVRRRGGEDAADLAVECSLLRGERPGDGRAHRDLDGDDDPAGRRLDNPAEAAQRHVALL